MALPVWANFMKRAHRTLDLPVEDFYLPDSVVQVEVCVDTYDVATSYCPRRYQEVFIPGVEPKTTCRQHTGNLQLAPVQQDGKKDKPKREYQF